MKEWFEQRKALIIMLGVVFIILSLFAVPAITRTQIDALVTGNEISGINLIIDAFSKNISDVGGNIGVTFANFATYFEH